MRTGKLQKWKPQKNEVMYHQIRCGRMYKLREMYEDEIATYFKISSQHLPGKATENKTFS
jgi:hypothetical protein